MEGGRRVEGVAPGFNDNVLVFEEDEDRTSATAMKECCGFLVDDSVAVPDTGLLLPLTEYPETCIL